MQTVFAADGLHLGRPDPALVLAADGLHLGRLDPARFCSAVAFGFSGTPTHVQARQLSPRRALTRPAVWITGVSRWAIGAGLVLRAFDYCDG